MYQADFHLHSDHSFDSKTSMADVCRNALAKNYAEICFTEHFSLNLSVPTSGYINWETYNADIAANRSEFEGKLIIRKGIEICEPHQDLPGYLALLSEEPMDFVLGSVHNVSRRKLRYLLRDYGKDAAYRAFFEETLVMVRTADIDGVAHLDLIKRYAGEPFTAEDFDSYRSIIEKILTTIIQRKLVLEINTSAMKNTAQTMPSENILLLYRKLGGTRISFGSDSHTGISLGNGFGAAHALARQCGFTSFCTFEKRMAIERPID